MDLKLLWQDINTVDTTITIYRSDDPIDKSALPSPVATLPNGTTEWTDPNTVRGKYYYYMFKTVSADDEVFSRNYHIQAVPRFGPGPNDLIYGNYELGYFGSIPSSEFISAVKLKELTDFTAVVLNTNLAPTWHKYARKGKIYIVPNSALSTLSPTWSTIYLAGLVYGTDDNGITPLGNTPTNQMKKIKVGPDTFIVRLMRGYDDDPSGLCPITTQDDDPVLPPNEFSDFICPLSSYTPESQRLPNIQNSLSATLWNGNTAAQTAAVVIEHTASNLPIRRGTFSDGRRCTGRISSATLNMACMWWPVLELVEE